MRRKENFGSTDEPNQIIHLLIKWIVNQPTKMMKPVKYPKVMLKRKNSDDFICQSSTCFKCVQNQFINQMDCETTNKNDETSEISKGDAEKEKIRQFYMPELYMFQMCTESIQFLKQTGFL